MSQPPIPDLHQRDIAHQAVNPINPSHADRHRRLLQTAVSRDRFDSRRTLSQSPTTTTGEGRLTDNLLALVPRSHQHMAAAVFRTVFAQPDPEAVDAAWDEVAAQLGARFPKVAALMADAKPEVLAFAAFPRAHWQKIWSTNPLERINKEIKRRSRVVGIFPNQASAIRLVGAILADLHDEWQATERRYLSEHSMATLQRESDTTTAELQPESDTTTAELTAHC